MSASYNFAGNAGINFGNLSNMDGASSATFAFWVNFNSVDSQKAFFSKYESFSNSIYYVITEGSKVTLTIKDVGATDYVIFNSTSNIGPLFNTGQWYHICWTWSGTTTAAFYIDGVLTSSSNVTAVGTVNNIGTLTTDFEVGQLNPSSFQFDGKLSYLTLFDRVLSVPEIHELMLKPDSISKGLQVYIPLTATVPTEYITGATGTITNATGDKSGPEVYFPKNIIN